MGGTVSGTITDSEETHWSNTGGNAHEYIRDGSDLNGVDASRDYLFSNVTISAPADSITIETQNGSFATSGGITQVTNIDVRAVINQATFAS